MRRFEKPADYKSLCGNVRMTIHALLESCRMGSYGVWDDFIEVRQLLESLPLSTGEYGLATVRLQNAERYLRSGERGAARYESGLLASGLRDFVAHD